MTLHPARAGEQRTLGRRALLPRVHQLGHAVGPGPGVGAAVESSPGLGVGQPMVCPQVDDDGVVARCRELGRDRSGGSVRESEDDDVVTGELTGGRRPEHSVRKAPQRRVVCAQQGSRARVSRDRAEGRLGVGEQQPKHLAACVPARASDGDRE